MEIKVQHATPGMNVSTPDLDSYYKVIEYPVITGEGVFVNLLGGHQIGPLPMDALIEVATREEFYADSEIWDHEFDDPYEN